MRGAPKPRPKREHYGLPDVITNTPMPVVKPPRTEGSCRHEYLEPDWEGTDYHDSFFAPKCIVCGQDEASAPIKIDDYVLVKKEVLMRYDLSYLLVLARKKVSE